MRLALIRQKWNPYGGAERFVGRALEALRAQGAGVTLVTRRWDGEGEALVCNPFYLGNVWRDWSFARAVCHRLAGMPFDLVQSHERLVCCDIYRAGDGVHREWLAQRRRVLGFSGRLGLALNPYHHYTLAAERALFASPRLKAVICNSKLVQGEIRQYFGLEPARLPVIYSGVDLEQFHPRLREAHRAELRHRLSIADTTPLFLFVGSGFERKGVSAALQALARQPAAELLVVGADRHSARYRAQAQRLGLGHRVHWLGALAEVGPCYGAADAFVLPTLYDPFPNAALEAFASGLPVLTSTRSGAAEFVRPGVNGFVADALDIDTLALQMAQVADQSAHMREPARAAVAGLSLEAMGERLLALYRELARGSAV